MSAIIHHGDCLEVLRGMADASVDAVVTDPPWKSYTTSRYDASEWHTPIAKLEPGAYASLLFHVLRDGGACLLWCDWECFAEHASALRAAGFSVRNCVVWAKPNHTAGDLEGNFAYQHEMAVFATRGRWKRHASREKNLWQEAHLFSRARRDHPTQKPIGLMRRSVEAVCPSNGLVLDPFAGSGSTGVACIETGRSFIGIEREAAYVEIARKRIADAEAQMSLGVA